MKLSSILASRTDRLLRPGIVPVMRTYSFLMSSQERPACRHCHIMRSAGSLSWMVLGMGRPLPLRPRRALACAAFLLASDSPDFFFATVFSSRDGEPSSSAASGAGGGVGLNLDGATRIDLRPYLRVPFLDLPYVRPERGQAIADLPRVLSLLVLLGD